MFPNLLPRLRHTAILSAIALASAASLEAEDIVQSQNVLAGSTWNDPVNWGGYLVEPGNNYFTTPGFFAPVTAFVTNGVVWNYSSTMRDNPAGGTFLGDSLTLLDGTRLLGKIDAGNTSTVNLIFGGGIFFAGPNTAGSATLAGTIRFEEGVHIGAIGVNPAVGGSFTQTIASKVIGNEEDVLQLTLLTEQDALRLGHIVFTGDLSEFEGTLYVGTALSGSAAGSSYSVQSSSTTTTLVIDTITFNNAGGDATYELATNETFGALIVGGTQLGAGTYDAEALNLVAGGGSFFIGGGSITVVPEPSTVLLSLAGFTFAVVFGLRKRRVA